METRTCLKICILPMLHRSHDASCSTYSIGMVGLMGTATLTKKRMGYVNTKMHGIIAWAGLLLSGGGFYVIYQNKNEMGKDHFTTLHSWGKLLILVDM